MAAIKTYRDLLVWQKAMVIVTEIYTLSSKFPQNEMYGLTSQIRRSAVSMPSNMRKVMVETQPVIIEDFYK